MHSVSLAFVWHQHQPYYPDDVGGRNPMPWVRLHATKDYWGMAALLAETPEMRATINLVPSLIDQLLAYTERGAVDEHLRVSRLPADGLAADERNVAESVAREEAAKKATDPLLRESAAILADAVALLGKDAALAAQVLPVTRNGAGHWAD